MKVPGNGDALEEEQPHECVTTGGVEVEQLEHIQAVLCHCRQSNKVADDAHDGDEDLTTVAPPAYQMWELVDNGGEEAFHSAEL